MEPTRSLLPCASVIILPRRAASRSISFEIALTMFFTPTSSIMFKLISGSLPDKAMAADGPISSPEDIARAIFLTTLVIPFSERVLASRTNFPALLSTSPTVTNSSASSAAFLTFVTWALASSFSGVLLGGCITSASSELFIELISMSLIAFSSSGVAPAASAFSSFRSLLNTFTNVE